MSNFNYNSVQIGGKLTADPELKTTPSGTSVTNFTVAVNGRKTQEGTTDVEFINISAWQQTAEFITRYFRKGSSIFVVGRLHNRTFTGRDGQKRTVTDVVANEAHFVDSKSEMQGAQGVPYIPEAYKAPAPAPKMEEIGDDDIELPF